MAEASDDEGFAAAAARFDRAIGRLEASVRALNGRVRAHARIELDTRKLMGERAKLAADLANAPSPDVALERFEMPKEAVDRIGELLTPGSSLIVSDNGLSDETGLGTDFVVATP